MGIAGIEPVLGIFFSFVIGVVFGGMATFLFRRMMVNRQLGIAQRKAAKVVTEFIMILLSICLDRVSDLT